MYHLIYSYNINNIYDIDNVTVFDLLYILFYYTSYIYNIKHILYNIHYLLYKL